MKVHICVYEYALLAYECAHSYWKFSNNMKIFKNLLCKCALSVDECALLAYECTYSVVRKCTFG